jgi:ribosome-binding protein aMBF1 (putative translation factor)
MNYHDYVAERETRDPIFRSARESLRPQYEFRRALIGARLSAGLTQAQLAIQMGTTQSAVARLESGRSLPTIDTLCRLADILGISFAIVPHVGIEVR